MSKAERCDRMPIDETEYSRLEQRFRDQVIRDRQVHRGKVSLINIFNLIPHRIPHGAARNRVVIITSAWTKERTTHP